MEWLVWSALFWPLAGFLVLITFSERLPRRAIEWIGPSTIFLSFISFLTLLFEYNRGLTLAPTTLFSWFAVNGINADFAIHLDHLALLMTLIVTGVGFLIHVYAVGYMEHENALARYFAVKNFFIFSMLLLVLAENLLLFFVGWEGVGVASYLLIGFWYERPSAAKAAKKAFIVNRIGDLGLLLGILLTLDLFGTTSFLEINQRVTAEFQVAAPILGLLTLLYFWGACGKSAQIPLQVWLPDAMEGPTPVSALIHAATMVTAGVYLVARMHPVFLASPITLQVITIVGAVTSLYAAFSASGQTDLKRVLAYSTISQLGLMFLACGAGAFFAAMFHLTTHAFVKALLFLSAGNVIHMMHGTTEMSKMGGLSKVFTKTNALFLIGVLSMSGIPPLAIFFSKDLILEDISKCTSCYIAGLVISLFTAFYLSRAYFLAFKGQSNIEPATLKTLKEAPSCMMTPVVILGVLSIFGGLLGFALNKPPMLMQFLASDSPQFIDHELAFGFPLNLETWFSITVALTGVGVAALLYTKFRTKLGNTIQFLYNSFYINELYAYIIVKPMKAVSKLIAQFFEPQIFNSCMRVTAAASLKAAGVLQSLESGQIRSYISWIVIGTSFFIVYFVVEGF